MSPRSAIFVVVSIAAVAQACGSAVQPRQPSIQFWAYENSRPQRGVASAFVFVVAARGTIQIGKTDAEGELSVPVTSITKAYSILFCRDPDGISCAAVRLDTGKLDGFSEFNVQMPTFAIVDRLRVAPR